MYPDRRRASGCGVPGPQTWARPPLLLRGAIMKIKDAIKQMRLYDRDFLIAIVIGLMFEDRAPVDLEMELNERDLVRMSSMQELFEENP